MEIPALQTEEHCSCIILKMCQQNQLFLELSSHKAKYLQQFIQSNTIVNSASISFNN